MENLINAVVALEQAAANNDPSNLEELLTNIRDALASFCQGEGVNQVNRTALYELDNRVNIALNILNQ